MERQVKTGDLARAMEFIKLNGIAQFLDEDDDDKLKLECSGKDLNTVLFCLQTPLAEEIEDNRLEWCNLARVITEHQDFKPINDNDHVGDYTNNINNLLRAIIVNEDKTEVLNELCNILENLIKNGARGSNEPDHINPAENLIDCNSFNLFLRAIVDFRQNPEIALRLSNFLLELTNNFAVVPSVSDNHIANKFFYLNTADLLSRVVDKFSGEIKDKLTKIGEIAHLPYVPSTIKTSISITPRIRTEDIPAYTAAVARRYQVTTSSVDSYGGGVGDGISPVGLVITPGSPAKPELPRTSRHPFIENLPLPNRLTSLSNTQDIAAGIGDFHAGPSNSKPSRTSTPDNVAISFQDAMSGIAQGVNTVHPSKGSLKKATVISDKRASQSQQRVAPVESSGRRAWVELESGPSSVRNYIMPNSGLIGRLAAAGEDEEETISRTSEPDGRLRLPPLTTKNLSNHNRAHRRVNSELPNLTSASSNSGSVRGLVSARERRGSQIPGRAASEGSNNSDRAVVFNEEVMAQDYMPNRPSSEVSSKGHLSSESLNTHESTQSINKSKR